MLRTNVFCIEKKVANMAGWQIWPWDMLKYFFKYNFNNVKIIAYAFVLVWHGLAVVWPQAIYMHALHIDLERR